MNAENGKLIWIIDLINEYHSVPPFYGYTTSPVLFEDVLIVQIGGKDGKTIAGFDKDNGSLVWTAGRDSINHQSPIMMTIGGKYKIMRYSNDR